jgi:hypothetical protein
MKKIILIILLLCGNTHLVFSSTNIEFSSDKKNYNIEDTIVLNIGFSGELK